ncbi:MAG: DUF4834 family protein [Rikenellaceae bacterium]
MEKLLSFILGTVIFFYLLSKVGGFLLRLFIKRKMNQFNGGTNSGGGFSGGTGGGANQNNNPFNWANRQNNQNNNQHKEGEVFISRNSSSQKRVKDKVGEYVDFEEVK